MKSLNRILLPFLALLILAPVLRADDVAPKFNHLAIHVHDLKVCAKFYSEVIGLPSIPEPFRLGKHAWFKVGTGQSLHLIADADAPQPKDKMNHLCFSVPSLEAFIRRLDQHGIAYENVTGEKSAITVRPDGVKQFWLQDPENNWIEINDAKE